MDISICRLYLHEKNQNWLNLITNENQNSKKIELIEEKINSDTVYKKYIPELKIHGSSINLEHINSKGNLCGIKILFVIEYGKRKNIHIDLNENPEYYKILQNIDSENVSIWILNPQQGLAVYGTSGSSGVIYMKTKDKNLKNIIKSTIKKNVG